MSLVYWALFMIGLVIIVKYLPEIYQEYRVWRRKFKEVKDEDNIQ